MENIQSILNKLNTFSLEKGNTSAIELDLMLDYTRKLYDILLTQKEEILSLPCSADEEKEQSASTQKPSANPNTGTNITAEDLQLIQENQETPEENTKNRQSAPSEEENTRVAEEITAVTSAENQNNDEHPATEEIETTKDDQGHKLYQIRSNISYEPPHSTEEAPFYPEEGIEEEAAEENNTPVHEIPVPQPEEKDEFPDYAHIFNYAFQSVASQEKKDIRKKIGINDKYLFLNELFNSQKKVYEDTLDKINEFPDLHQATEWIKTEIAPIYKWYDDDETVLGFYDVMSKHFSVR